MLYNTLQRCEWIKGMWNYLFLHLAEISCASFFMMSRVEVKQNLFLWIHSEMISARFCPWIKSDNLTLTRTFLIIKFKCVKFDRFMITVNVLFIIILRFIPLNHHSPSVKDSEYTYSKNEWMIIIMRKTFNCCTCTYHCNMTSLQYDTSQLQL